MSPRDMPSALQQGMEALHRGIVRKHCTVASYHRIVPQHCTPALYCSIIPSHCAVPSHKQGGVCPNRVPALVERGNDANKSDSE